MAQLATAWAQVSRRLAPGSLVTPGDSADPTAEGSSSQGTAWPTDGVAVGSRADADSASPSASVVDASRLARHAGLAAEAASVGALGPWQGRHDGLQGLGDSQQGGFSSAQHAEQQHNQQAQQQQQQQQHFEAIIIALKLALASLQSATPRRDGRSPATRAVQLASTLADLCAAGLPLDAFSMCAGVVAEAAEVGALRHDVIRAQLGPSVAALVHDMLRVRQAPRRIELLDDEGAGAIREWCLAFHDVRACVVEVVNCWDELQHMAGLPAFEQQALALEALQIGAPLGHALGLGSLSALMEDACLKVLFPDSYASTSAWLRGLMDPAEDALFAAQRRLLAALDAHPGFSRLSGGLVVKARTKSLFSVMKKLLHLGDLSRGGRSREELYDLLGMRAIVQAPGFLPADEAEAAATKACYIVQDVASTLWRPIPSRSKDYIVAPKPNGYQSIHLTLQLGQLDVAYDTQRAGTETAGTQPQSPSSSSFLSASESSWSSYDGGVMVSELPAAWPTPSASAGFPNREEQTSGGASGPPGGASGSGRALSSVDAAEEAVEAAEAAMGGGPLCLELQIRTVAMDRAAESGDAAHAVYKGGLDARTARQLQTWTQELRNRLSAQPRGRLLLRAASTATLAPEEAREAAERRRRRRERRAAAAAAATAAAGASAAAVALPAPKPAVAALPAAEAQVREVPGSPSGANAEAAADAAGTLVEVPPQSAPSESPSALGVSPSLLLQRPNLPQRMNEGPMSSSSSSSGAVGMGQAPVRPVLHLKRDGPAVESTSGALPSNAQGVTSRVGAGAGGRSGGGTGGGKGMLLPRPVRQVAVAPGPNAAKGNANTSYSLGAAAAAAAETGMHGARPPDPSRAATSLDPHVPISRPGHRQQQPAEVLAPPPKRAPASSRHQGTAEVGQAAADPAPMSSLTDSPAGAAGTIEGGGLDVPVSTDSSLQEGTAAGRARQSAAEQRPPPLQQDLPSKQAQDQQGAQAQGQEADEAQKRQQQQQQQQQQLVMLFGSLGSVDDWDEQQQLVIGLAHRDAAAAAEQLFRHLDVNGDGRLSLGEVRQVLLDLAAPASERDAAALMAALDRNGDGGISIEEFVEGVSQAQLQHEREEQERREARRREAERRAEEERRLREQQRSQDWQPWQHRW